MCFKAHLAPYPHHNLMHIMSREASLTLVYVSRELEDLHSNLAHISPRVLTFLNPNFRSVVFKKEALSFLSLPYLILKFHPMFLLLPIDLRNVSLIKSPYSKAL